MLSLLLLLVSVASAYKWEPVLWGGGGYVSGIVFHPRVQGLVYSRTDVGGAYRRDPGSKAWIPLLDWLAPQDQHLSGIWSMAVDANDDRLLYLACGLYTQSWGKSAALLRSADRGQTWARTDLPFKLGGNEDGRGQGERLQVDPNLGSVLFLGTTHDGLYRSTDAARTWTKVGTFPGQAVTFVEIDRQSGKSGAPTPHLYAGVASTSGAALYQSWDGGASWSPVPNQPQIGLMPLTGVSTTGRRLYMTYGNALGPNGVTDGRVFEYNDVTTGWTDISPVKQPGYYGYGGISVLTSNPKIMACSTLDRWWKGDQVWRSIDAGRSWTLMNAISTNTAPDNEWQSDWKKDDMGSWITDIEIDPFSAGHVIYNYGGGLWETDGFMNSKTAWKFAVKGIEEAVVSAMVSPPSGAHLLVTLFDCGGGRYDNDFNSVRHWKESLVSSRSVDYAQYWPNFVARTADQSQMAWLSWDNGVNWYPVKSKPIQRDSDAGRMVIAAGGSALLWVLGPNDVYYSTDNAQSWSPSSGYPSQNDATYVPIADRAADHTFYTYDFGRGALARSTDNGRTFQTVFQGLDTMPWYASAHQLVSLPTSAGDLWLGTTNGLYHFLGQRRSAPYKIPGVASASAIGYGAAPPGASYPTLFIAGKVGNVDGLFRSLDQGATWQRIDDDQHRYITNAIVGDPRVFGRVYLGTGGRGILKGEPA